MIAALVFSKDRACQLDLLLTSLERNGNGILAPVVVYRATTADHLAGYDLCRSTFPDVPFIPDTDGPFTISSDDGPDIYACFLTDDSVLYRNLPPLALPDGVLCFSLRLGRNTRWCYPLGRRQNLPRFDDKWMYLEWDWTVADGDFGYPASVDGHIFRASDLAAALQGLPPGVNPNRIEEHLVRHFAHDERRVMAAFPQSCLVGLPLNVVSDTHRNRNGEIHGVSADDLLARYLAGERIQLDRLDFTGVRGAHQEIGLVLS